MAARAESAYIPTQEDAITKAMFKITMKVIEQTLLQPDAQQPVITEHCGADMEWLKKQPAEVMDACALMQRDGSTAALKSAADVAICNQTQHSNQTHTRHET